MIINTRLNSSSRYLEYLILRSNVNGFSLNNYNKIVKKSSKTLSNLLISLILNHLIRTK